MDEQIKEMAKLIKGHTQLYVQLKTTLGPLLFEGVTTSYSEAIEWTKADKSNVVLVVDLFRGKIRKLARLAKNDWEYTKGGKRKSDA